MTAEPRLAAFLGARLDEEEPREVCGCLDANHWPPCTPQPCAERKRREITAMRLVAAQYAASVRSVGEGLSVPQRRLAEAFAAIWNDHPDYREALGNSSRPLRGRGLTR